MGMQLGWGGWVGGWVGAWGDGVTVSVSGWGCVRFPVL